MSREGVEGAPRLEGRQADPVQPVDEQPPATVVLGEHRLHVRLARLERLKRGVLGDRRRRHDPVLVDLDDRLEDLRRAHAYPTRQPVIA